MARFGCLLMIVSMVLLFAIIVVPVIPFLDNSPLIDGYLKPIMCQPDERIERRPYQTSGNRGGVVFTMDVYCINNENQQREESDRWMLAGMASFALPFVVGLITFIAGVGGPTTTTTTTPKIVTKQPDSETLSDKLRELKQAKDDDLISSEEYDRLRQKILDEAT